MHLLMTGCGLGMRLGVACHSLFLLHIFMALHFQLPFQHLVVVVVVVVFLFLFLFLLLLLLFVLVVDDVAVLLLWKYHFASYTE